MVSVYSLKPAFQKILRPLANHLAKIGITPNQVTVAAAAMSVIAGGIFYWKRDTRWVFFIVPIFLFIRMALNALDGILAREYGMKSSLGAVLNEIGDVISDTALYLPFAAVACFDAKLIVIIVIFSIIGEMTGVVAVQIGASRRYDGPMGKSDRAFVFSVIALLLGLAVPIERWLKILLWLILLLLVVTIFNRVRQALKEVR
jgi:CDP-diacylglycerol--glycerol-3-phosphate 3-phosphatidyltransferase